MQHLRTILQQLRIANLTVKPQKCQLDMAECVYLGHVVGRGGVVRPELSKLEAIQAFSQPATKKQVRAFLGIIGYYRKFIPKLLCLGSTTHRSNKEQANKGLRIVNRHFKAPISQYHLYCKLMRQTEELVQC